MPFEPLQIASRGGVALSIDRLRRIRLSTAAMKELGLTTFTPVVISVDVENKRLGVVKQELARVPNASVVRPDKRGYLGVATGKLAVDKLALSEADLPAKFAYIGRVDEGAVFWETFELVANKR